MIDFLGDLLAHSEWANAVLFHTWGKGPARDHEELRRRAEHMIGVQQGFLAVFRGDVSGGPPARPPLPYGEIKLWAEAVHRDTQALVASLTPTELDRQVQIPWIPDPPCVITVGEALVQVALHTQHHRGQCMTRLKDFGGEPKNVDWIIWLWKNKPAPRWN